MKPYTIAVVGIGPGDRESMTLKALHTIEAADTIVGYSTYLKLIEDLLAGKEVVQSGMTEEIQRCEEAIALALQGKQVAVVSSGDAGVYGMASLILELAAAHKELTVEVVPGVTAALSGAALLGSPLTLDFACISLSDLLVPWEQIERRLKSLAASGMAVVIYNPGSRSRKDCLPRAAEIFLEARKADTLCAITRNIGRKGESKELLTLGELKSREVDMRTTVFIGAEDSMELNGYLLTRAAMTRRGRAKVTLQASETSFFEATLRILPPDPAAAEAAANKFLSIAMPLHGLGVLEEDLIRMAGIQGTAALCLKPRKLFVFCADNGVVKQGVTQTGQEVTTAVCEHLAYGGSTVNRMAALADCAVVPVDVGTAGEPRGEEILRRKVRSGTRDFTEEAAMTREECLQALCIGMELAAEEKRRGTALLLAGEMGIGNTTTSAALTADAAGTESRGTHRARRGALG